MDLLQKDEIIVKCQRARVDIPTGRCAVLTTTQKKRTLITQLGASLHFNYNIFVDSCDSQYVNDNAALIYISGYFLKVCVQTVKKLCEIAMSKQLPVVLNLNAVWVVENFIDEIMQILPSVDYVIGNELVIKK